MTVGQLSQVTCLIFDFVDAVDSEVRTPTKVLADLLKASFKSLLVITF